MSLKLNSSGGGSITLQEPVTANNQTLTLPDATGTVQVSGAPISGTTGTFTGLVDISAASAGQIRFPATQNTSSNANTLDDYEEGTWTPLLLATGSNPTVSYNEQFGRYIKIGKQVTAQFYLATNSYSGGSGSVRIGGLPFVANADRQPTSAAGAFYIINFQTASGYTFPSMGVQPATAQIDLLFYSNNSAWGNMGISGIPTATYSAIQATVTYLTD